MNNYERMTVVGLIDGYYLPRPGEGLSVAFQRAKAELLQHMKRRMALIEEMTEDQYRNGMGDEKQVDGEV